MPSVTRLTKKVRGTLCAWAGDPLPQHRGRAICAWIILKADEGWSNARIARSLGVQWNTVANWRESFAHEGLRCFDRPISPRLGRSKKVKSASSSVLSRKPRTRAPLQRGVEP
jgi:hypothetical protein